MREQLRETIDRLFRDAPQTAKTAEIKEEILQNLLDKYDDLLREGRDEQSAYHAAISGIGDVGTLIAELRREAGDTPAYPTPTAEPAASPTPPAPARRTRQRNPPAPACFPSHCLRSSPPLPARWARPSSCFPRSSPCTGTKTKKKRSCWSCCVPWPC